MSADYRKDGITCPITSPVRRREKGGVVGRRERVVKSGQAHVEMDQATQNAQVVPEDYQATSH
ncbi:hypothetical protein H5410_062970 [Solanum commersonii]|uniref:Uncharacterized protein n=1 Tax=Solanum commersonii TaxID=4109 RepID=A0A9J5WD25_SOLCO|nr:hypothetical protein H5410_062970 [Solanum commersonii]